MRNWKAVWNSREAMKEVKGNTTEEVFTFLKDAMGITIVSGNKIGFNLFREQFDANLAKLQGYNNISLRSFFDVGCGTGSYLYYLCRKYGDIIVGGVDYGASFIETAKMALRSPYIASSVTELYCTEAIDMDTTTKYDCVYSRSIFQYFPSEEYGCIVAKKMLNKANRCVGIFDLFDPEKKESFLSHRRSMIENYDEKYANTLHQFYPKEMFLKLADRFDCDVLFSRNALSGYWNEPFVYDVYLYKRG